MVEFTKKRVRKFSARGYLIVAIFVIFILWVVFFSGLIKENCKQDRSCFDRALAECNPAKFLSIQENNLYEYSVKGRSGNICSMEIELRKMGVGTPIKLIERFEGKSMECELPRNVIENNGVEDIGNIINYCSGPLKEEILVLIVDRMYGLIIKNIGEIAESVRSDLFEIR